MRKLYLTEKVNRFRYNGKSASCFYYTTLGTERHLMFTVRNTYRHERKMGNDKLESRITVFYFLLSNPVVAIRKASEL